MTKRDLVVKIAKAKYNPLARLERLLEKIRVMQTIKWLTTEIAKMIVITDKMISATEPPNAPKIAWNTSPPGVEIAAIMFVTIKMM